MDIPLGLCTGWCLCQAFPPSIPFSTRKPLAVKKYSTVTSQTSPSPSGWLCVSLLCSTSALCANPTGHVTATATAILCLHLALVPDSKPTWNRCLVYQLSYIKEQFSEKVKSLLYQSTHFYKLLWKQIAIVKGFPPIHFKKSLYVNQTKMKLYENLVRSRYGFRTTLDVARLLSFLEIFFFFH